MEDTVEVCHERPEKLNDARYVIELPYVCRQRFLCTDILWSVQQLHLLHLLHNLRFGSDLNSGLVGPRLSSWRTESPRSAFLKANRTPNVDHVQGYHRGHRSFYRSLCQQSSDSDFVLLRQLSVPGRICPVPTVL